MFSQIHWDFCSMINTMLCSYCQDNQITDTVLIESLNSDNNDTLKLLLKDKVFDFFKIFLINSNKWNIIKTRKND